MAITMLTISVPSTTMIIGSISEDSASTASSTSASKKSAVLPSMPSSAPDSSPIETICSTMFGNTPEFVIAAVRLLPVLTSLWICLVAIQYTWLPEAPPTESSASTSGTPAANMVASVRVQRAMVDLRITSPNTGSFRLSRSMNICTASERFHASRNPQMPPIIAGKMMYQLPTNQSEIAITTSVGAGRSAPKLENTDLNAGMTKIMITAVMMMATATIDTG